MAINLARLIKTLAAASLVALVAPDVSVADDTTYGQDATPDSTFWSGSLDQGYGFDKVPGTGITHQSYRRDYGQDPVPSERFFERIEQLNGPRRANNPITPGTGSESDRP